MTLGLSGHIARARRLAQKRGQVLTTAHVVLSLLETDERVGLLLQRQGVSALSLHEVLSRPDDEPQHAVDLAVERTTKSTVASAEQGQFTLQLLLFIVREPRWAGHRSLLRLRVDPELLASEVLSMLKTGSPRPLEDRARKVVKEAARTPRQNIRRPSGAGPCQVALAEEIESKLSRRGPRANGGDAEVTQVQEPQRNVRSITKKAEEPLADLEISRSHASESDFSLDPAKFPLLAGLGRNLTELAANGLFDPVIGRDAEIEQVLDVLSRRRANNPLLVGSPGVGKTAIVEGLARVLAGLDHVPEGVGGLGDRILVELSPGALLSGTGVRGALSERVTALREEVRRAEGRVILFLDEIHMIVGPGDAPDSLGNELKTALSRGELPCVGATTVAEYRRVFERDTALARRFTRVHVDEPSPEVCETILRGIAKSYELHHVVAIADDALKAAVDLSVRYIAEGQLPDKAIAVLDQAAARVRRRGGDVVAVEALAQVVAERASVPVDRLLQRDADVLLSLEDALAQRVKGQEKAISCIARSLRRSAVGFCGRRPLGTFLFLGSTGVGKTEMAKAISELLFPGTDLLRIDMSELSEAHGVARMLGAPPGYVGHDEGGQLTEPVRQRPYRLLLLDEIEKAHLDVLLSLLPLLDEGHLTDGRGRRVDFTNTVVVMTSNLGVMRPQERRGRMGFSQEPREGAADDHEALVMDAARAALPPELWNRIDEPLYFRPLSRNDVAEIARELLHRAAKTIADSHGIELVYEDSVVDTLIDAGGFDPELGARPMRRTVARLVEGTVATALLEGRVSSGERVWLRGQRGRIVLTVCGADAAE